MIKRKPQLIDPRFFYKFKNIKQSGGNYNHSFIWNFLEKYYLLIIIVLFIAGFLYWRYINRVDNDKIISQLISAQIIEQNKKKQNPLVIQQQNNEHIFINPHPQVMNDPMNHPSMMNHQTQQHSGCTSCGQHNNDNYKFNKDSTDLMFINGKNQDINYSGKYYGMAITEPNEGINHDFIASNNNSGGYFQL